MVFLLLLDGALLTVFRDEELLVATLLILLVGACLTDLLVVLLLGALNVFVLLVTVLVRGI